VGSLRVVIAEDHVPTRVGLRIALEVGGFAIAGEAGTAESAVRVALDECPDACLLDVDIPGGGVAATATIKAKVPETVVLLLTASADRNDLIAAIRAGASGYLPKTIDARRLAATLRGALSGEPAVPRALVAWLFEEIRVHAESRPVPFFIGERRIALTTRERQVLDLMFEAMPTREIAARLGISQITVRRHIADLVRKLNARDRQALVALGRLRRDRG
jgi:two-component system, NarL family, nitrate/nitrite response regulator NarL